MEPLVPDNAIDRSMLDLAAKLAWRAAGNVEPNPLVGCVIAREGRSGEMEILGVGHHERFGGPHAEANALAACAARGLDPTGATAYVTLEPCGAPGRNPPCVDALIGAKIARVVYARHDEHPIKSGGAARLRSAGIETVLSSASMLATRLADPFITRLRHRRPFVIVKWAQTLDGKIATASGQSQWISSERSRLRVHRLRARVDAIITGIGTVRADNPRLTARGVPVRRVARRVVLDPRLEMGTSGVGSFMLDQARDIPVTIICTRQTLALVPHAADRLRRHGVEVIEGTPGADDRLPLAPLLSHLYSAHDASNVLVEAGPGTIGTFFAEDLVDECQVFIAPTIMGDAAAPSGVQGLHTPRLADVRTMVLYDARPVGTDVRLIYRRAGT